MNTYFLGTEEVHAYLRDFVRRLRKFEPIPTVWCPVTKSGDDLLNEIVKVVREEYPEILDVVRILPIEVHDEGKTVAFIGEKPEEAISGQPVLLVDGAIHSGNMMSRCANEILKYQPLALSSYALVIKRGGAFIPTLWAVMIDETDRAYFLLDEIPNNRLDAQASRPQPQVHLRKLCDEHLQRPPIVSGVKSIDRMTWSDRHFQMQTSNICTYVLGRTETIVGFLTMHFSEPSDLVIDEIVVDPQSRRQGYGPILLRFADTLARHADCRRVRLNAIKERVGFYEAFKYRAIPGACSLRLDDEEYQPMERTVLYHQSPIRG